MIIIGGTIEFNAENRAQTIEAIKRMVTASQAEAGCIFYEFSADFTAPDKLHLFEVWANDEALQAHRESPHMALFVKEVAPTFTQRDIKRFVGEMMS